MGPRAPSWALSFFPQHRARAWCRDVAGDTTQELSATSRHSTDDSDVSLPCPLRLWLQPHRPPGSWAGWVLSPCFPHPPFALSPSDAVFLSSAVPTGSLTIIFIVVEIFFLFIQNEHNSTRPSEPSLLSWTPGPRGGLGAPPL